MRNNLLLLVFPALLMCGCQGPNKNQSGSQGVCTVSGGGGPPVRSSSIDEVKGMRYTLTIADIQQALDLYSWAFDLGESAGRIEIGLEENGTFRSLVTPKGDHIKVLLQLTPPNEGRLTVIDSGRMSHCVLKQLGVFHQAYFEPRPINDRFELIKFSTDPGKQGWPQKLVLRVNRAQ